jgi:hypothetical protein
MLLARRPPARRDLAACCAFAAQQIDIALYMLKKSFRIDHVADILDRVIAHERDRAGICVDLHLDHVAAVRNVRWPSSKMTP